MPIEKRAKVVAVKGICNAGLEIGDEFLLKDLQFIPVEKERSCCIAYASILANIGRLKFQETPIYISCPDPGTGNGGNIIFEVSPVDDYENS